jgi:TPR repeat protein
MNLLASFDELARGKVIDEDRNFQWRVARKPAGELSPADFEWQTSDIPEPGPGQVLLKTHYLGLAPVMRMYMQGTGVIADINEAVSWFRRAADRGDPPAQFTMGTLYANGRGVQQDPVQAHLWFTLAASGGHRAAAANLVLYQEMMSDQQIGESQRLAAEWVENFNAQFGSSDSNASDDTSARAP